jgi:predicted RNA-binding Zn ribbon-like protein
MSEDSYISDAGDISLDFANTNDWHASEHPIENLHDYHELISWAKKTGMVSSDLAGRLSKMASEKPEYAIQAYNRAVQTREAIYRIFVNRYAGKPIATDDLVTFNSVVCEAMAHRQLVPQGNEFRWDWASEKDSINLVLWKVTLSAAELLTSDKASRVSQCEDDRGCGFLFIDMSKNHSRRWCSMESCGNRAKARRHYSRSKQE